MMYWNGDSGWGWGWGWGAWLGMSLMMVLFWGLVAWAIVAIARSTRGTSSTTAQQILDERLAHGEISVAEFEESARALRGRPPTG